MQQPDSGDSEPSSAATPHDLAALLEPTLAEACGGRLGSIAWFRTDWQRGGAATGRATWSDPDGPPQVVAKLPVHPRELRWLRRLQAARSPHVPRLLAGGEELGGYDLAWVVLEHLPHGPLALAWQPRFIERIARAAAAFAHAASLHPVDPPRAEEPWAPLLERARSKLKDLRPAHPKEWNDALREVERAIPALEPEWNARAPREWVHGDLHPGNAMTRRPLAEDAEVCLIDFAEVHAGHWIEDAVYLERLHWTRPDRIAGHPPVKSIAAARRAIGLSNGSDHARLAAIRRLFMAATAPAFSRSEGGAAYLEVCLGRIGESLRMLHAR